MHLLCETNQQETTTLVGRIQHWIMQTQWQTSESSWGLGLQKHQAIQPELYTQHARIHIRIQLVDVREKSRNYSGNFEINLSPEWGSRNKTYTRDKDCAFVM